MPAQSPAFIHRLRSVLNRKPPLIARSRSSRQQEETRADQRNSSSNKRSTALKTVQARLVVDLPLSAHPLCKEEAAPRGGR